MAWKRKNLTRGAFELTEGRNYILVHHAMGLYCLDFGIRGMDSKATEMARDKTELRQMIKYIKTHEFVCPNE